MPRKGDRQRNAKREKASTVALPPAELYAPPRDVDEHEIQADMLCGCRIVERLQYHRGVLVHFAIIWIERGSLGPWQERYSCDTGHGHFHEHTTGHRSRGDRRDIRPLYSQVDVQECFDTGYDLVQDRHDRECRGER